MPRATCPPREATSEQRQRERREGAKDKGEGREEARGEGRREEEGQGREKGGGREEEGVKAEC